HLGSATKEPDKVTDLIKKELDAGRYIRIDNAQDVEEFLEGPFQTSPLGIRIKANGKFRLIQDFSSPHHDDDPTPRSSKSTYKKLLRAKSRNPAPINSANESTPTSSQPSNTATRSINSQLRAEDWPTTWCTTENMCRAILMLPRTAQAFVRDTVSAFRQIFLHRSQWAGTVVEWQGAFYVDMFLAFGLGPACGVYGLFGDALADIARAEGISPNGHWVDDNTFLRFPSKDLEWVNEQRRLARATLLPDAVHDYGRTYWVDQDGFRHGEDYSQPARILPGAEDGFNCGLADIDRLSEELGWPWAPEKDAPWSSNFTYGGIDFHIATRELSLPTKKRTKYTAAIEEWQGKADGSHTLNEAQSLHGKLEHATVVYKHGKWRLKGLLDFIRSASKTPKTAHSLRHQGPRIKSDLAWWKQELECDRYRSTFDPAPPLDVDCFCDGSTGFGAGLRIGGRERCFPLRPTFAGTTEIMVVEALALELAILTLVAMGIHDTGVVVRTDNTAVFGAFKKGRMEASEPDKILSCVASIEQEHGLRIDLLWVASEDNTADGPSRGITPVRVERLPLPTLSADTAHCQAPEKAHKAPAKRKTFAEIVSAWSKRSKISRKAPSTATTSTSIVVANTVSPWQDPNISNPSAASTSEPVDNEIGTSAPPRTTTSPPTDSVHPPKKKIQSRRFQPNAIVVKPHPNRPDVDGPKRFATWAPERPDGLDPQPAPVRKVLLAAFAKGTHKSHSTGLAQWHHFCDRNNVPERDRGPAPPHLVELWVSQQAGTKSGGYLKDWIAALKAWHHINKLPWTVDDNRIQLIRRGATALNNPTELVTVTVATCGLWGLFRLGELLLEKVPDFDPLLHVKRTNVSSQAASVNGKPTVIVTIKLPRTKTSNTGDTVVLAPQESPSDPVGLLQLHLQRNPATDPDRSPLFSYWEDGSSRVLTKKAFERTLQSLADRAKLPGVHGHSMRIGGCTTLLIRNVPTDKVMLHGRWDSNAFKRYIRNHAEILAPFLASNVAVRQQLVAADPELAEALPGEGTEVPQEEEDIDRPQEERANVAPPDRSSAARAPAANANRAIPATGSARTSASRVGFR
ncbi:hypothetical protein CF328_g1381, partial [Tilletia controversa]